MIQHREYTKSLKNIPPVAILFQSHHPPAVNNIRKPMKPTGYKDSGADIAVALKELNINMITPMKTPDILGDENWCFPDNYNGIKDAYEKGARLFWLNTVLYKGHPITKFFQKGIKIVGQSPDSVHKFDDKSYTNKLLKEHGLPVPKEILLVQDIGKRSNEALNISNLTIKELKNKGFNFPLVIKPLRGRGSQGVYKILDEESLIQRSRALLRELVLIDDKSYSKYGDRLILEEFLDGEEITITVMPSGKYIINEEVVDKSTPWALPIVRRFGHHDGIAPYNGVVAVAENSNLLDSQNMEQKYMDIIRNCEHTMEILSVQAPIRIDCRFKNDKAFIFDVNFKPNMTGAIRPHRLNQKGLTAIAAEGINWSYKDLIFNILCQSWTPESVIS